MMQNPTYAAGFETVLKLARERNVAVQTIKSIVRRPYPTAERGFATWYEPLTDQSAVDAAVHWVLGEPSIFLNTAGDIHVLPKVLDAASRFHSRPEAGVMQTIVGEMGMQPLFV